MSEGRTNENIVLIADRVDINGNIYSEDDLILMAKESECTDRRLYYDYKEKAIYINWEKDK